MKNTSHFDTVKAVIAFLIVLVGFSFFLLFYSNSENLFQDGSIYSFITLVTIGLSLLVGLFYLVSNSQHPQKAIIHKSASKKHKKGRK
jgi:hypothetical protein